MQPVSVCIIAKNEEKNIERCLSSLAPYDFEIVLVDTGSTDRTKELAAKYTDKIYDFTWCDDFAAARNFSLEKASNSFIFMLDCDEWIISMDVEELHYFMKKLSHAAGAVMRQNITGTPEHPGRTSDQTERFFSKKRFHYTGIIHEQLTPKFEKSFECLLLNTTIGHDGYCMSEQQRQEKGKRNLLLLQRQAQNDPENPYIFYQLGKAYELNKDWEQAKVSYETALSYPLDTELAFVQALICSYGQLLLNLKLYEEALTHVVRFKDLQISADYSYLAGIVYENNSRYEDALDSYLHAVQLPTASQTGANSFLSYYRLGKILLMIEEYSTAKSYFIQCGEYPPALAELAKLRAY